MTREMLAHIEDEEFSNLDVEIPMPPLDDDLKKIVGDWARTQHESYVVEEVEKNLPAFASPWNPRMTFDIALGIDSDQDIMDRYLVSEDAFNRLLQQPAFRQEIATHTKVLRETGVTFTSKAKMIAEETLEEMFNIISSHGVAPKDRISAWKSVAFFGGLEPKVDKEQQGNMNTVNIQINL
jgi:hypothetical protein